MKKLISILLVLVMCLSLLPTTLAAEPELTEAELQAIAEQSQKNKANVIVTNDGECDDMDSMIRYLNYANEFNTKAIIITSSSYHWTGGTIIDPATKEPAKYDKAVHGTSNINTFEYTSPTTGETYEALRYNQSRWTGMAWFDQYLDGYEAAYENLVSYDPSYPSPEYLRSVTYMGNVKYKGEMLEETEGSVAMEKMLLENEDGVPLYVLLWGGCNTLARTLKSIEEDYNPEYNPDADPAEWERIYNKITDEVVFYMILNQDNTYNDYIKKEWPEAKFVHNSGQFWSFAYMKNRTPAAYYHEVFGPSWSDTIVGIDSQLLNLYLLNNAGWDLRHISDGEVHADNPYYTWNNPEDTQGFYDPALNPYNAWPADEAVMKTWGENENRGGAAPTCPVESGCNVCWNSNGTPKSNASKNEDNYFISEGDSPSFFYLISNGLRSDEDPTWGGWGGRFVKQSDVYWTDKGCSDFNPYTNKNDANYTQTRWFPDLQEDWSARAQWTVTKDGNLNPQSAVMNGLDLTAYAGETLVLDGVALDPNGDKLSYNWWQYYEVDTYAGEADGALEMTGADTADLTLTIPADAEIGDTLHLIFEAKDDNKLPLKTYKRVIITVGEEPLTEEELAAIAEQSKKNKANVIVTNDGECDDMDSMIRYLNYANEFNTKAIIITSSSYHWTGGTIIDPNTKEPAKYDRAIHGTANLNNFEYTSPTTGETYTAVRYNQSRWTGMAWFEQYLDGYEAAYENLVSYDPEYPTPDYLRSVTYMGNVKFKGEMQEDTEGSVAIEKMLLENEDGVPLYVLLWGGCNTVARSLKAIEEDYNPEYNPDADPAEWERIYNKICDEVVFYMILNQDNTYNNYIKVEWPDAKFVHNSGQFWSFAYMKNRTPADYYHEVFGPQWSDTIVGIDSQLLNLYLLNNAGWDLRHISDGEVHADNPYYTWNNPEDTQGFYDPALNPYNAWPADEEVMKTWGESENRGGAAPTCEDTSCNACWKTDRTTGQRVPYSNATNNEDNYFISEGDSPSFFYLLSNGLRSDEDPTWGGWGGRFVKQSDVYWTDKGCSDFNPYTNKNDANYTQTRWFPDLQEDWSARAQWTVTKDGNLNPQSAVMNGLDLTAAAGETLVLDGVALDPNGDALSYSWWQYYEVDTYAGELDGALDMTGADTDDLTITIPADAKVGDTIHLIFEAIDNNELSLKTYKRVIITVDGTVLDVNGAEEVTLEDEEVTFTVTASNTRALATMTLSFEVAGLEDLTVEGVNGWYVIAQDLVDGVLTVVVGNNAGVSSEEAVDVLTLTAATPAKVGDVSVTLTEAILSAYVGDGEEFQEAVLGNVTVTTTVTYSVYDVNQDGTVNQLDITRAQRFFGTEDELCDVDNSGEVNIADLILILKNYS